jgi:hypothetical protein
MSQIFKKIPPKELLINLLTIMCEPNEKFFIIDKSAYKLGIYNNEIKKTWELLLPYYYNAKQFYLTRKLDYKNFLTIIRHLCNIHSIPFNYHNSYDKSTYNIIYKIFKNY